MTALERELEPESIDTPDDTPELAAAPTVGYLSYLAEVEQAISCTRGRARKRFEEQRALLQHARFITLRGVTHHYIEVGPADGEPLVLVHGWNCSCYWWRHVLEPLAAAGYRVVAYDLRGHGFSDAGNDDDYSIASFANDFEALIQALGMKRPHVSSFSLGAFVALHYAASQPQHVRSLMFFNFGLLPYSAVGSWLVPRILNGVFNRVLRPLSHSGFWLGPFLYARTVLARNTPRVADIQLGILGLRCCNPKAAQLSCHSIVQRTTLDAVPEQMRQLQVPTLLVAGDGDQVMHPTLGRKLMALAPQGSFFEMPRCGHLILFELPEQVVALMRMHLGRT